MHGAVRAQSLISLDKPAKTWIPVDSEIYTGRQLRSSKPEVGFFLADKDAAVSEEDLKQVTEPSAPEVTFSLENPVFSVAKHKARGAEAPEVLYQTSTPKPESLNKSWYPKLDDLETEFVKLPPHRLSFNAEKFLLPVTTSTVITVPPSSLGHSHLVSPYKSLTEFVSHPQTLPTAVSTSVSPPTYSASVIVTSAHPASSSVVVTTSPVVTSAVSVTAPSQVSVSTGLPSVYPVTTAPPVILITAASPVVTPVTAETSVITTAGKTVVVSTTPVVTSVSTSVITTAPTLVLPSVITSGPSTLPPAVGVGVGIPVSAAPPPPALPVVLDTDFEQDIMAEEKSFIPPPFKGVATDDAEQWVRHFENYCE